MLHAASSFVVLIPETTKFLWVEVGAPCRREVASAVQTPITPSRGALDLLNTCRPVAESSPLVRVST
jgi:hypothetical protein